MGVGRGTQDTEPALQDRSWGRRRIHQTQQSPPRPVSRPQVPSSKLPRSRPRFTPVSARCPPEARPTPGLCTARLPATACLLPWPCPGGAPGAVAARRKAHRQEGVDDVGFDGAQRLVLDDREDLFLLLQADEVPEPGPFGEPGGGAEGWAGQGTPAEPRAPPLGCRPACCPSQTLPWPQLPALTRHPDPDHPPPCPAPHPTALMLVAEPSASHLTPTTPACSGLGCAHRNPTRKERRVGVGCPVLEPTLTPTLAPLC